MTDRLDHRNCGRYRILKPLIGRFLLLVTAGVSTAAAAWCRHSQEKTRVQLGLRPTGLSTKKADTRRKVSRVREGAWGILTGYELVGGGSGHEVRVPALLHESA